ncbi:hypothetical protein DPX16_3687 [Anabarilius grahami]|uniref:Uncharacterized protein n=1 Tax=Anabarilius grahami TaxID=495550 RepID=A0A3N0YIH5_ANAGA|nr:hypothetical protein DPX16_3687 [Anabarilius grahami]
MVTMERHLWLNLADIGEKEKGFLLDTLVSPAELFCTSVEAVMGKFREVRVRSAAFRTCIPLRSEPGPRQTGGPGPSRAEAQRQGQLSSVASRAPPPGGYVPEKAGLKEGGICGLKVHRAPSGCKAALQQNLNRLHSCFYHCEAVLTNYISPDNIPTIKTPTTTETEEAARENSTWIVKDTFSYLKISSVSPEDLLHLNRHLIPAELMEKRISSLLETAPG